MKRKTYWVVSGLACFLSAGCASIAGTWHRDTSTLSQVKFPLDVVTFSEAGSFTASGQVQTNEHTWTGAYRWNNEILTFMPNHQMPKTFSARITSGDKLVLTNEHDSSANEVSFHRLIKPVKSTKH